MDGEQRRVLLDRWYRVQLRAAIPALIAKWEPVIQLSVPRSLQVEPRMYASLPSVAGRPRPMNRSPRHELRSRGLRPP
jgi:hypothetical protein